MNPIQVPVPTRAASAVAAALLAAGGVMAATTAAGAAPHPKPATTLSISNKVIAHGRHHADAITGVLSSHHSGVAHEVVALEARYGKAPRWAVVAKGTTGSGGAVSFTVAPKVKAQFKLVFAGDKAYRQSQSNVITLRPVK